MRRLLEMYLPSDHSRQVTAFYFVDHLLKQGKPLRSVLDLGCGAGDSVDLFRQASPQTKWVGLDLEDSPEVRNRDRDDAAFVTYDGVTIPFIDASFDLIYCRQVFEHVLLPRKVLREAFRVLQPAGFLVGSVSQLETFHSYSLWNFTPYGFKVLLEEVGFQLVELRPAMDAPTWLLRRLLRQPRFFNRWVDRESPFNLLIELVGRILGRSPASINAAKLVYACAFCFLARKPDE